MRPPPPQNNVLQSRYFEVADLASVAQQLDAEENDTLDDVRPESVNMDDTGMLVAPDL